MIVMPFPLQTMPNPATVANLPGPEPSLPAIAPTHSYTYAAGEVSSLAVSLDGESLLLVRTRPTVDIWDALICWWPECAALVALLALLLIGMRVFQRVQAPRQPHCRRCNYLLLELTEPRCPECGYEDAKRRPRLGRRRGWRIALIALLGVGYSWFARFGDALALRQLGRNWFDWPCDALLERAKTTAPWLSGALITRTTISRQCIGAQGEEVICDGITRSGHTITLLQRGRSAVVTAEHRVAWVNLATGDVTYHLHTPQQASTRIIAAAAALESDEPVIWIALNNGRVHRWNLQTDESLEVPGQTLTAGRTLLSPLAAGGRVALPQIASGEHSLRVLDEPQRTIPVSDNGLYGEPALSPGGDLVALVQYLEGSAVVQLRRVRGDGPSCQFKSGVASNLLSFTPNGHYLVLNHALLFDVTRGEWRGVMERAPLAHPKTLAGVASKGNRLVRTSYVAAGDLVEIFDLPAN